MLDVILIQSKLIGRLMYEDRENERDERIDSIINTSFFVHIYVYNIHIKVKRTEKVVEKNFIAVCQTFISDVESTTASYIAR